MMKKHQNVYTMNSAQKKRYLIFCVGILAIMIISYSIRLPSQRQHNARMLNISLPDYNLALQYRDSKYDEDIYNAFLKDPYTEMYYKAFNDVMSEKYPDIEYTAITLRMLTDDPVNAADQLETIYTSLRGINPDKQEKNWQSISDAAADRLKDTPEVQKAYREIYEQFALEKSTEGVTEETSSETTDETSE